MSTQYPQHPEYPQYSAAVPGGAVPGGAVPGGAVPVHGQVHEPESAHGRAAAASRPQAPVPALLGLLLLALAGAWLVAAPFLLGVHGPGDQRRGAAWTAATRVDFSTGAAVVAVAVATLLGYLASSVTWWARYRRAE